MRRVVDFAGFSGGGLAFSSVVRWGHSEGKGRGREGRAATNPAQTLGKSWTNPALILGQSSPALGILR